MGTDSQLCNMVEVLVASIVGCVVVMAIVAFFMMSGGKSDSDDSAAEDSGPPKVAPAIIEEMESRIVKNIPPLTIHAGPRDPEWPKRVMEEMKALMEYIQKSKKSDEDWFQVMPDKDDKTMTKWKGKCWYFLNNLKFNFDIEFEIPVTYPKSAFEIAIPKLDGTTNKMYRGGKICLTDH